MKILYNVLKVMICGIILNFVGSGVYQYYHYKTNMESYVVWSAPWYLGIEINAMLSIIGILLILIIMSFIRKKVDIKEAKIDKELLVKALIKIVFGFILTALLLFIPAGTLNYWNAWLFVAILFIPMFIVGVKKQFKKI